MTLPRPKPACFICANGLNHTGSRCPLDPKACPNCGSLDRQRYQWKPDLEPTRTRHQCFDCSWDSGWVPVR